MNESSRPGQYSRNMTWIFVLVPIVTTVMTEAFKTRLIWRIRLVDFIDLVFLAPFMLIMLLLINDQIYLGYNDRRLYRISLGLLCLTMYGHAMHLTGNAINTYSTEVHQYIDRIPSDTYELIYFFDELLGHYLFFTGILGTFGVWILADQRSQIASWQDYAAGGLLGVSYAIAIIESSQAWFGFVLSTWLLLCACYQSKCGTKCSLRKFHQHMADSYWFRFGVVTAVMILLGEILYYFTFGSFIQPSQLGL